MTQNCIVLCADLANPVTLWYIYFYYDYTIKPSLTGLKYTAERSIRVYRSSQLIINNEYKMYKLKSGAVMVIPVEIGILTILHLIVAYKLDTQKSYIHAYIKMLSRWHYICCKQLATNNKVIKGTYVHN